MSRIIRWQIASRVIGHKIALPFVNDTVLLTRRGMTGSTLNWYCGLAESSEMGFALHYLRRGDDFVDVGANIGAFTILAATTGAHVIAVEPIPTTARHLLQNVHSNNFDEVVEIFNIGLASAPGSLKFTQNRDTTNRVVTSGRNDEGVDVQVNTLDALCTRRSVSLIKIDVEGFEDEVISGGGSTLENETLDVVIIETNDSNTVYGQTGRETIFRKMERFKFSPYTYDPLNRQIISPTPKAPNTIFIRNMDRVIDRIETAGEFRLCNGVL